MTLLLMLLIALLYQSCSADKKTTSDSSNIIYLDLPQSGEDTLRASNFADSVMYIPLETMQESLINNICGICLHDSFILVTCSNEGLFLFRNDGKFIRKIGGKGSGPGEYIRIFHAEVARDTIYISSTGRRGFLRYKLNGDFCDEIELNYQPVYFSTTFEQKLACYIHEEGRIFVYNNSFYDPDTLIAEYGVTEGRYFFTSSEFPLMTYLQKTASGLLFNSYLSDTIWNITGDKKEPIYILDLKEKLLPYELQTEFCNGDFEKSTNNKKPYHYVHLIQSSSYFLAFQKQYSDNKLNAIYIGDIETGEIKRYNTTYIYDDIVGQTKLNFFMPTNSSDYIVSIWDLQGGFEIGGKNHIDTPSIAWINQMKSISENSNPILVLVKIKKVDP